MLAGTEQPPLVHEVRAFGVQRMDMRDPQGKKITLEIPYHSSTVGVYHLAEQDGQLVYLFDREYELDTA